MPLLSRRAGSTLAAGVLVAAALVPLTALTAPTRAVASPPGNGNDVTANLFEWNWNSVASECTNVLGPNGYGAVQVAPPEDSVSLTGHPWWEVYQPVDYSIGGRMGTETQFISMVNTCHAAGVKVYADAVINHMTGNGGTSYGGVTVGKFSYPGLYATTDFHSYPGDCPESDNQIHNWNDPTEVTKCELSNLSDLRTEADNVRSGIAGYLNHLLADGVDGFRVDAAKHVGEDDMAGIEAKLTKSAYIYQEVMPGSTGVLAPSYFFPTGDVLEFNYGYNIKSQFQGSIANLKTFGTSWGLDPSANSVVFVSNHDTERAGSTLGYKNGTVYNLATEFELAWGFGTPQVYSSFDWTNSDDSPPADANGYVSSTACGSGWECVDRQQGVLGMVGFHNATKGDTNANWWDDGSNLIAFSRNNGGGTTDGWITLNNGSSLQTRTFFTGLAAGTYCDVIHGTRTSTGCTGPSVVVDGDGYATVSVAAGDAVALDTKSLAGTPSAATGVTETFKVTGAAVDAPVYLVGSISALGSWAPASAVPMTQTASGWTATVSGLPASTAIQYKYIAKNSSGSVTWEQDPNHTATTPASGSATLNDSWHASSSSVNVTFNENASTSLGQNVFVVGSIPALGNWNAANAAPLSAIGYPVWSGTVTLPPNTSFSYKYIKKNSDGTVVWESDPNRSWTTGAAGSATTNDSWR